MADSAVSIQMDEEIGMHRDEDDLTTEGMDRGDDPDFQAPEPAEAEAPAEPTEPEQDEGDPEPEPLPAAAEDEADPPVAEQSDDAIEAERQRLEQERYERNKRIMIPKTRLDDEIAKRRKLEQRIAEIEKEQAQRAAEQTAPAESEVDPIDRANELLMQANEAILDGDLKKAAQLQAEALKGVYRKPEPVNEQQYDPQQITEQVRSQLLVEQTVESIYNNFPVFNPDNEGYDSELVERAVLYERAYIDAGHPPHVAVQRAADDALRVLRADLLSSGEPAPAAAPKPDPVAERANKGRNDLKKKVEMAGKQPPEVAGSGGKDEPVIDILQLSDDEFDALPESTRAKLRGDY